MSERKVLSRYNGIQAIILGLFLKYLSRLHFSTDQKELFFEVCRSQFCEINRYKVRQYPQMRYDFEYYRSKMLKFYLIKRIRKLSRINSVL